MVSTETIKELVERRTYFKGRFIGKYWADAETEYSDGTRENFYKINIYEGEVHTHLNSFKKWHKGSSIAGFQNVEVFDPAVPDELMLHVTDGDGSCRKFKAAVHEAKLINYRLYNKQHDNDQDFGTIEGIISGYIVHYDEIEVKVPDTIVADALAANPLITPAVTKTSKPTGRKEEKADYARYEYYNTDHSTYWGDWSKTPSTSGSHFSFWNLILGLLLLAFAIVFLLPILWYSWKLILILGGLYLFAVILSVIRATFRFLAKLLQGFIALGFLFLLLYGLFTAFNNGGSPNPAPVVDTVADTSDEQTTLEPAPQSPLDTVISHNRKWVDYRNNNYAAKLSVLVRDFRASTAYRNNYSSSFVSTSAYDQLVQDFHQFDKGKLNMIYTAFDSLRAARQLDEYEFAEMVVSCIQDIPYVLLLDKGCDVRQYNDGFTQNYLNNGGECDGYIKYGIRNPVEFMATLKGDCDTRTLMIFTVLQHYNYDVAMLGSEMYSHSIIGINLPYKGQSKIINGKRYIVWETTAPNARPGELPREISDMRYWSANLISR
ncbi:hypothetical protein [Pontibacter pamirensis]|uniref:hypothetical protein n=1 Tax=Pontibacter pamirensis TaxID=2562824 RepID=UPI001389870C|nr:hypothetical protein [Pontibacter pamirensis]